MKEASKPGIIPACGVTYGLSVKNEYYHMKKKVSCLLKSFFISVFALLLGHQATVAQDALTAVKINIQNVTMSSDKKTISYDVYLQDVDATYPLAVCGYLFRLVVPQADLGTNAKTVTVTNATTELGKDATTMTVSGSNWLMLMLAADCIASPTTLQTE